MDRNKLKSKVKMVARGRTGGGLGGLRGGDYGSTAESTESLLGDEVGGREPSYILFNSNVSAAFNIYVFTISRVFRFH